MLLGQIQVDKELCVRALFVGPTVNFNDLEAPVYKSISAGIRLVQAAQVHGQRMGGNREYSLWIPTIMRMELQLRVASTSGTDHDGENIQYTGANGYKIKGLYSGLGLFDAGFFMTDDFGNPVTANPTSSDEIRINNARDGFPADKYVQLEWRQQ